MLPRYTKNFSLLATGKIMFPVKCIWVVFKSEDGSVQLLPMTSNGTDWFSQSDVTSFPHHRPHRAWSGIFMSNSRNEIDESCYLFPAHTRVWK